MDSREKAFEDVLLQGFFYDPGVFREFFTTPFQQYRCHVGKRFAVLQQIADLILATEDEDGQEDEYLIRLETGEIIEAWGHEVCKLDYEKCK